MELEGSLKAFSLPEVLQFLALGKMTGNLTVTRAGAEIVLEIRDGRIINSSTMDRPNKLGQMLVNRGVIPRSDLEAALDSQRTDEPGRLLGELLVERGHVTRDQLSGAIRLQMEEEIWDLFGWREGSFKFEHAEPYTQRQAAVEIEIEPLLLEGSRRLDEWENITKNIPNDEAIYSVIPPNREIGPTRVELKEREWTVLALINGHFSVGSIIARTGFGTFETYRILNTLLTAGLIQVAGREEPDAPAPPPPQEPHGAPETRPVASVQEEPKRYESSPPSQFWKFGRKKAGAEEAAAPAPAPQRGAEAPASPDGRFVSPIGMAGAFVNRLLDILRRNAEFNLGDRDRSLVGDLWRPIVNICPKADMIRLAGERLDMGEFEAFASTYGEADEIQACYEDALEALSRLIARLYKIAAQRIGESNADRLFQEAQAAFDGSATLATRADFNLAAFLKKAAR